MVDCYICSNKPVTRLTYIDSLGSRSTEVRCESCAVALKSNEDNCIKNEVVLDDSDYNLNNSNAGKSKKSKRKPSPYKRAWLSTDTNSVLN
jgi:hypothetical protein